MRLTLTEPVHAVMIDTDLVFLDIDADTYFCLPLPAGLARLEGERLETPDPQLGEELVAAGLARHETVEGGPSRRRPPPPPSQTARRLLELAGQPDARIRPKHLGALAAAIGAGVASRRRTFRRLIEAHSETTVEGAVELDRLLLDIAVWRRLAPWLPLDGVCLFRSGMLAAFLRSLGHRPTWVFGVRTWPFQAHCWLQVEDIALDDEAERLCAFAPILGV